MLIYIWIIVCLSWIEIQQLVRSTFFVPMMYFITACKCMSLRCHIWYMTDYVETSLCPSSCHYKEGICLQNRISSENETCQIESMIYQREGRGFRFVNNNLRSYFVSVSEWSLYFHSILFKFLNDVFNKSVYHLNFLRRSLHTSGNPIN